VQHTATAGASRRARGGRKVAVEGKKKLMESGVRQH
jgi:hypothetical protein